MGVTYSSDNTDSKCMLSSRGVVNNRVTAIACLPQSATVDVVLWSNVEPSSREKSLTFRDSLISLNHSVGHVKGSLQAKNQFDMCSHLDRIPACDRQTHRHRTIADICTSIASHR